MTIGERLRELRQRKGWGVDKLASRSGVHAVAVRYYETGHRQPTVTNLRALCNALGVTLGAFHRCDPYVPPARKAEEAPTPA